MFCNELRELLGTDRPTLMETHLLVCFAVGTSPMPDTSGVVRLAALSFECKGNRHERLLGWLPRLGERIGENQALVGDAFEINTRAGNILSIRSAHHNQARSADAHVRLSGGRRP